MHVLSVKIAAMFSVLVKIKGVIESHLKFSYRRFKHILAINTYMYIRFMNVLGVTSTVTHTCTRIKYNYIYVRICVFTLFRQNLLRAFSNVHMNKVGVLGGLLEGIVYHRLRCGRHAARIKWRRLSLSDCG